MVGKIRDIVLYAVCQQSSTRKIGDRHKGGGTYVLGLVLLALSVELVSEPFITTLD